MNIAVSALALSGWAVLAVTLEGLAEVRQPAPTLGAVRWGVRVLSAEFAVAAALIARPLPAAFGCGIACVALVAAGFGDARTGYIFDSITIPGTLLAAAASLSAGQGLAAAGAVVAISGTFGLLVVLSRGRWMGLGDVKAMLLIGAAFGPLQTAIAIFTACLSGLVSAGFQRRLARGATIPFGPHLAVGAMFTLVAGEHVAHVLMGP
jgi:prepilin signal peptidase PulO-like enzyme (type II secretory pathway)